MIWIALILWSVLGFALFLRLGKHYDRETGKITHMTRSLAFLVLLAGPLTWLSILLVSIIELRLKDKK